ncbi:MAG: hypothetical protein RL747_687 [Bacteroidota bacterium]|jgi:uncharacterized paraquat-inducible protein A|nr:hypothetical protein [Bacteroidia bacterium]
MHSNTTPSEMKRFLATLAFTVFAALTVGAQCPMCKAALTSSRDHAKNKPVVGNGINKGILMLLATPYVLLGTAGVFFYQYKRRQKYGK